MASGTLGKLTIDIAANVASLQNDVGKVRQQLGKMEKAGKQTAKSLNRITKSVTGFKNLALAVIGITGPLIAAQKASRAFISSIERADRIGKIADKIGVSTDALQEFRFAAKISGVEVRTLDMALQRFSRRIGEVGAGQGELLKTAKQYNVAVRDSSGQMRKNVDIMGDFAEIIKNTESEQERLRISFKLFDSEGAALVNLLKLGKDGMNDLRQEARDLGIVLGEETVRGAEDLNDEMTKLTSQIETSLTKAFLTAGPTITKWLSDWASGFQIIVKAVKDIGGENRALEDAFQVVRESRDNALVAAAAIDIFGKSIEDVGTKLDLSRRTTAFLSRFVDEKREQLLALAKFAQDIKPEPIEETKETEERSAGDIAEERTRTIMAQVEAEGLLTSSTIDFIKQREKARKEEAKLQENISKQQLALKKQEMANQKAARVSFIDNLRIIGQESRTAFELFKAVAIAQTVISTIAATQSAFKAGMDVGGPFAPVIAAAYAAAAFGAGVVRVAQIKSSSIGTSSVGGAGGGGGGAITSPSPGETPVSDFIEPTLATPAPQITIVVEGNIVDQDKFARELLPSIEKAVADGVR